jgi:putative membrane protein
MIPLAQLPTLNAFLNGLSATLLVGGYVSIRRHKIETHKKFMLAAFTTSCLFLISYLTYHFQIGSKHFEGQGVIRPVYFSILISHTILAASIVPLVIMTLKRALKGNFERHKRIARRTLPIWIYVSVTGVMVYWMLYQL